MTTGRILYDNKYRDPLALNYLYSAAEVPGFEKENAIDWRDFSLFRIASGFSTLDITMDGSREIDSFSWYIKEAQSFYVMRLKYESAPAVFTLLAEFNSNIDPLIGLKTFPEVTVGAARRIRIEFEFGATTNDIRQLVAGSRLDFPIGQHQGISPPNLRGQFVTSNVIGVNGSFLGRDKVRADIQGQIDLEPVDPVTFVREKWIPLMTHAERYAFFYAWDLDDYPNEVVFAWARDTPRPTNTGPAAKMSVELPWAALSE